MTEQEVIDFLKNNKAKGIAFAFLPIEVKLWCSDHDSSLIYFQKNNVWNDNSANDVLFEANEIVALPEDFKLTKLTKKSAEVNQGWWEEFEIDDCREFLVELVDTVTGKECHFCFNWFDWIGCLNKCKDQGIMLTNFGGWQYDGDGWYMDPQVYDRLEHYCFDEYLDCNSIRPAIPKKIRFWRER